MDRRVFARLVPLAAAVCLLPVTAAFAAPDGFSVGVLARADYWRTSLKEYDEIGEKGAFWDPDTIESATSDVGLMYGPEAGYRRGTFFARAFYLQGPHDFGEDGEGSRRDWGVDVGIGKQGGAYLGYRSSKVGFDGRLASTIADHTISDAVLGVFLQTDPEMPGFLAGLRMGFGVRALINVFSEERFKENPSVLEGEVDFGYRFTSIPLVIKLGYGIWVFEDKSGEKPAVSSLVGRAILRQEDLSHGGTAAMLVSF